MNISLKVLLFLLFLLFGVCASSVSGGQFIPLHSNLINVSNSTGATNIIDNTINAYKENDQITFKAIPIDNVTSDVILNGNLMWNFGDGTEIPYNSGQQITHTYNYPFIYPISWGGYYNQLPYSKKHTYNWLVIGDVTNTKYNFKPSLTQSKNSNSVITYNNSNQTIVNITYYSDLNPGNYSFNGIQEDMSLVPISVSNNIRIKGDNVSFSIPLAGVIYCMWNFGDGTTSYESSPTHTYNNEGFYFVQVLVVDDTGKVKVGYATIEVKKSRGGYVYWVMGPHTYGLSTTEVYNSTGGDNNNNGNSYVNQYLLAYNENDNLKFEMSGAYGSKWKWDFGDGTDTQYTNKNSFTPSHHTYNFPFMWPFFWMSYDSGSWWKSDTYNFMVVGDVENTRYNFIPDGGHDKTNYDYNYDKYNHIVNIMYYSDNTNTPEIGLKIKDGYYTDIAASASNVEVSSGDNINFNVSYSGNPLFVMWSFGDGHYSYETNPTHSYSSSGIFYPHVFIVDRNGNIALGITPPIGVNGYHSYPQIYVEPQIVKTNQKFNISIVEPASYNNIKHTIQYSDGNSEYKYPNTSPYIWNYSYSNEGVYSVDMMVSKGGATAHNAKTVYVIDNNPPNATLYVYPSPASYIENVIFNPMNSFDSDSERTIPIYNLNGNEVGTYTLPKTSPSATIYGYNLTVYNSTNDIVLNKTFNNLEIYSNNFSIGNYTAKITVWDGLGAVGNATQTFTVINNKPVAQFYYSPSTVSLINESIYFNGLSSYDLEGPIVYYSWNFGDGTVINGTNKSQLYHTYLSGGIYNVTLTVWDELGESSSISKNVIINNIIANFSYSPIQIVENQSISFNDLSSTVVGAITNWNWNFDDGTISTVQNPTHIYNHDGIYYVTLKVKNNYNMTGEITKLIVVNKIKKYPPIALYTYEISGNNVSFNGSNSYDTDGYIVSYYWDFGDGTNSTVENPIHNFSSGKTYAIKLTVTDNSGLKDSSTKYIYIKGEYTDIPVPNYVIILIIISTLFSMYIISKKGV